MPRELQNREGFGAAFLQLFETLEQIAIKSIRIRADEQVNANQATRLWERQNAAPKGRGRHARRRFHGLHQSNEFVEHTLVPQNLEFHSFGRARKVLDEAVLLMLLCFLRISLRMRLALALLTLLLGLHLWSTEGRAQRHVSEEKKKNRLSDSGNLCFSDECRQSPLPGEVSQYMYWKRREERKKEKKKEKKRMHAKRTHVDQHAAPNPRMFPGDRHVGMTGGDRRSEAELRRISSFLPLNPSSAQMKKRGTGGAVVGTNSELRGGIVLNASFASTQPPPPRPPSPSEKRKPETGGGWRKIVVGDCEVVADADDLKALRRFLKTKDPVPIQEALEAAAYEIEYSRHVLLLSDARIQRHTTQQFTAENAANIINIICCIVYFVCDFAYAPFQLIDGISSSALSNIYLVIGILSVGTFSEEFYPSLWRFSLRKIRPSAGLVEH